MKKVVVGMSGGIDSFVTALMLKERGFEVVAVNLELWGKNDLTAVGKICRDLHIPLILRKGEKLFREVVVDAFVKGYLAACTPSPCCICNGYVKWQLLKQVADELGIPFIATGHYVRIEQADNKYYIRKGKDINKDQSYFLWGLSQDILSRAVTPLGDFTKEEVKAWALLQGYKEIVRRKESMGICFLEGKDYRDFIRQTVPGLQEERGWIVDRSGKRIGKHEGLLNYTIGQKRGIPLVDGHPMYVAEMDVMRNLIVADVKAGLEVMYLHVKQVKVSDRKDLQADNLRVKVRGLGLNPRGTIRVTARDGDRLDVCLSDPAWAVAPGQPVAFYREDRLVGGGIIE